MENQTKSYVVILPTMNGDPEEFVFIEEEEEIDDLSHWEFIHSSDSDSDSDSVHFDPTVTNFIPIPGPDRDVVDGDDDNHVVDRDESSNDGYVEPHPLSFPNPMAVTNFTPMVPGPARDFPVEDDVDDHFVDRDESSNDGYVESRTFRFPNPTVVTNFTPIIPGPDRDVVEDDEHVVNRDESSSGGYVESRPVTNFTPMISDPARDIDDDDDHVVDRDESSNDGYVESRPVTNVTPMIPGPIQDFGDAHDDNQEDDDGYGYGYDLDDELIPKALRGKFGRQRMRKLGKRGFAKTNSKKSPILYARPGCVHGKHGLGLKHSF